VTEEFKAQELKNRIWMLGLRVQSAERWIVTLAKQDKEQAEALLMLNEAIGHLTDLVIKVGEQTANVGIEQAALAISVITKEIEDATKRRSKEVHDGENPSEP
jgi:hypothetical protein